MSANRRSRPVIYAEEFGAPSQVWLWRQAHEARVPVLTHNYVNVKDFPHEPVWSVTRRRGRFDRMRRLVRLVRGRHRYRLWRTAQNAVVDRLRAERATLIHAHFGPAGLRMVPVARALNVPLVVTFHGFDITRLPEQDEEYRRALLELFDNASCVAVSEHVRNRLAALGCDRSRILPLGTPLPEAAEKRTGGAVRIVTVARLVPMKGIADLVDAVRAIDGEVELHVVGEGPERENIEARAGDDPRIVLHGRLAPDAVARQLDQADLFVLNSRRSDEGAVEGFPISVLEAMAARLPVIGTRHGGIPESVADGETGLLVPERDTNALRQAVENLAGDSERRRAMGDAGRRVIEQRYELGACTQRLLEYYDEISNG